MRALFILSCAGMVILGTILAFYSISYVFSFGMGLDEMFMHATRVIYWMPADFFALFGTSTHNAYMLCYPLWLFVAFSLIFFTYSAFRNFKF